MTNPIYGHSPHPAGTMFGYDNTISDYRIPKVTPDGGISTITGLSIPEHDYIELGYTGSDMTSVTYKLGGSGGTTVATLTLAYSAGILQSVTRA